MPSRLARNPKTSPNRAALFEPLEGRRLLSALALDGDAPPPQAAAISLPARQVESLDRGVVAVYQGYGKVYVGWRMLGLDPANVAFNVYRSVDGAVPFKLNAQPVTQTTDYVDYNVDTTRPNTYSVRPVVGGVEGQSGGAFTLTPSHNARPFTSVPLQKPAGGTTPAGETYTYSANDTSVGDLDGDGEYEMIVKWDPSNSKDNAQSGYTGNVYVDAYKMDGTRLWRIDLGRNIRAGAHYTQFIAYDLDGDGRAEVAMKTAPGTVDGVGQNVLLPGDKASADYRNSNGYVLSGPEYLSVFDGLDGSVRTTIPYNPPRGSVSSWGDSYGNRVDRFLATTAYLDGVRPSLVMARGYYTRTVLVAYDLTQGGELRQRWIFDTNDPSIGSSYRGQGDHSLTVGDVDGDGRDEITYGAMAVDDDGRPLYNTRLGHGDALHLGDFVPGRPGLEVFNIHEDESEHNGTGGDLRDARTGEILVRVPGSGDVGRGVVMDVDPRYPGAEMWHSGNGSMYNATTGQPISSRGNAFINFGVWWDADPLREMLDGTTIAKWNWDSDNPGRSNFDLDPNSSSYFPAGVSSNNSTKQTPALSGDILGDWREEVVWRTTDSSALHIYSTTIPSTTRMPTLMHDVQYRQAIAWQNVGYNQPPHPSFFLGAGMDQPPTPNVVYVQPTPLLNAPWQSGDVGARAGGTSARSTGEDSFSVRGGGADIWGTSDAFRFVYQPLSGDGEIVIRVDGLVASDPWAKAGVMIRGSLDAGSAYAGAFATVGRGLAFQTRGQDGWQSTSTLAAGLSAPYYLRLVRDGNVVTASASPDGNGWTQLGSPTTIALGQTAYVGMAVTAHDAARLARADFSDVSVTATTPQASVQEMLVNGGSAQRSSVKSVIVRLDHPATPQAGAFALTRRDTPTPAQVSASNPSGDGRTWVLSFVGGGVTNGSLDDGVYDLTIRADAFRDAAGRGLSGGDRTVTFHRLYGDGDGDRRVSLGDFLLFRGTFGQPATSANFRPGFDYDGDDRVSLGDFIEFRKRFGTSYSY